jgi:hypothetical protein
MAGHGAQVHTPPRWLGTAAAQQEPAASRAVIGGAEMANT